MKWIITEDLLEADSRVAYRVGNVSGKADADLLIYEFRLSDDDGEVYYVGRCGDLDDAYEEQAFAPLDWAMADSGCTTMEYRKVGTSNWETL